MPPAEHWVHQRPLGDWMVPVAVSPKSHLTLDPFWFSPGHIHVPITDGLPSNESLISDVRNSFLFSMDGSMPDINPSRYSSLAPEFSPSSSSSTIQWPQFTLRSYGVGQQPTAAGVDPGGVPMTLEGGFGALDVNAGPESVVIDSDMAAIRFHVPTGVGCVINGLSFSFSLTMACTPG